MSYLTIGIVICFVLLMCYVVTMVPVDGTAKKIIQVGLAILLLLWLIGVFSGGLPEFAMPVYRVR